MRISPSLVLTTALALAACEAPATAPAAAPSAPRAVVSSNDRTEVPLNIYNACNSDVLTGTGEMHVVMGSTSDAAGGSHSVLQSQVANIKLTGTSGASYVGSSEMAIVNDYNYGSTQTVNEIFKVVGKGQAAGQSGHFLVHITVNANGNLAAFVTNAFTDCR